MVRPNITIRPAQGADWTAIERIYRGGIRSGHATFQTEAEIPSCRQWFDGKMAGSIYVAVDDAGAILGWTALSQVSSRRVYAGVAEVSIYIDPAMWGHGVGGAMMENLVRSSEEAGIWTLQAGIFPENQTSIRLHKRAGFRVVGIREKFGQMEGVWRDVVLMERRSSAIF